MILKMLPNTEFGIRTVYLRLTAAGPPHFILVLTKAQASIKEPL